MGKFLDKMMFIASNHSVNCFECILDGSVVYLKNLETV